jgi:rhodanese-related sulfurtransferase
VEASAVGQVGWPATGESAASRGKDNMNVLARRAMSSSVARAPRVVTLEQLTRLMDKGACRLVDVRERSEVAQTGALSHGKVTAANVPLGRILEGALAQPDEAFKREFGVDKPRKGDVLVFSCRSGVRSEKAGVQALADGFTDVHNYKGSANEWFEKMKP